MSKQPTGLTELDEVLVFTDNQNYGSRSKERLQISVRTRSIPLYLLDVNQTGTAVCSWNRLMMELFREEAAGGLVTFRHEQIV